MKPLEDRIAVVAGATRGGGRGIACMLGEAGATVYCTGRSTRGHPASGNRPETIEETAEMVTSAGGQGIPKLVDHTVEEEVEALFLDVRSEKGRLDILVNDIWGGDALTEWGTPFWKLNLEKGFTMLDRAIRAHIITSRYGVPIMIETGSGLVVEVTDGDDIINRHYRGNLFYDLSKTSAQRLAYGMSQEMRGLPDLPDVLRDMFPNHTHDIAVVALTPGFLRSEAVLEHFGVSEENWQDAVSKDPFFVHSESPFYLGRAVVALAGDPNVRSKSGRSLNTWDLAKEYGFTDMDGSRPDWGSVYRRLMAGEG